MKLIISIDTEEDNWDKYSRYDNPCENIEHVVPLQDLFDSFGVLPTYLLSYPVASCERSQSILKRIVKENKCEIGAHCHPWNTPPFDEDLGQENTMLENLPFDLIVKKLNNLHKAITTNLGVAPVAFRSGRYSFGKKVARALNDLHYKIDTSVTPYDDWSEISGSDFSSFSPEPFMLSDNKIFQRDAPERLLEVPVTIGFFQRNFKVAGFFFKYLQKKPVNRLRLIGLLRSLNLLNVVSICPEIFSSAQMIKFTKLLIKKEFKVVNMSFHSTSLKAGLGGFVKTPDDEKRFFQRIKEFLAFANDNGIESIRLSDFAR